MKGFMFDGIETLKLWMSSIVYSNLAYKLHGGGVFALHRSDAKGITRGALYDVLCSVALTKPFLAAPGSRSWCFLGFL